MEYLFQVSGLSGDTLAAQLSWALEKQADLTAREKYPWLWRQLDRLRPAGASPSEIREARRRRRMRLAIVNILLGVFLFVPGVMEPLRLLPALIIGAAVFGIGVYTLLGTRRNSVSRFDKASRRLLDGIAQAPKVPMTVTFTENEMLFRVGGDNPQEERIPYGKIDFLLETQDLLVPIYAGSVSILQKADLTCGTVPELTEFLAGKGIRQVEQE